MNFNISIPPATPGGWISLGILAVAAISILYGMFLGLKRGFSKTVIRILTIAVAAVLSYVLAISITGFIDGQFAGKTLEEVILTYFPSYETAVDEKTREIIAAFDAETAQLILSVVIAIVVSPIVFVVVFFVAKLLLFIVYWILGAIVSGFSKKKGFLSTVLGGALGVVQGALVVVVILLPVSGFLSLADDIRTELLAREDISVESAEKVDTFYTTWLDESIENPLITAIADMGGDKLFKGLTSATVEGEEYDMGERAILLADVYVDVIELKGMDWKAPNDTQKALIEDMVHRMGEDEYTARLLSGVLRGASDALIANVDLFGLEPPYDAFIVEALSVFTDSDMTNIGGDLDTMLEVYFLLADNEILVLLGEGDEEGLKTKLTGQNGEGVLIIDTLTDTLHANPRTDRLVTLFSKLSVSIMADQLGLDEDVVELYENIKTDFSDILAIDKDSFATEDEYREEVAVKVSASLEENGILLEEEIVDGMADYICDNFSDVEEITDEQINEAILSYYSAYTDFINNGGTDSAEPEV